MTDIESKYQSTVLRVSAHDRDTNRSGETNADFSIDIRSQNFELKRVVAMQVINAQIPNVFYNIPSGLNTFDFNDGSDHTITITPGQYDLDTLVTDLLAQIDLIIGGTSTYAFNDVTQKLTITASSTIDFDSNTGNPIAHKLGFGDSVSYSGTVFNAPEIVNIIGPHTVSIHSPEISSNVIDYGSRSGTVRMIAEVPLDNPFGFMCYYRAQSSSDLIKYKSVRNFNRIGMILRDIQGRRLDISNHDWSITLRVWYLL